MAVTRLSQTRPRQKGCRPRPANLSEIHNAGAEAADPDGRIAPDPLSQRFLRLPQHVGVGIIAPKEAREHGIVLPQMPTEEHPARSLLLAFASPISRATPAEWSISK